MRIAGGLVKHRYMQLAPHALVDLVHPGAKGVHAGQQLQGLGVNLLTFGRQGKTGASAPAQGQAQPRFQVFDMSAHGAGADVELELGRTHAAAIDHTFEHTQQADVHVAQLAQRGAGGYLH
jgi:hypothetical protein